MLIFIDTAICIKVLSKDSSFVSARSNQSSSAARRNLSSGLSFLFKDRRVSHPMDNMIVADQMICARLQNSQKGNYLGKLMRMYVLHVYIVLFVVLCRLIG
jgi:hypothetical protein